ncbi:hypothetical protein LINGRAHAP2_LOCUS20142 [Linum grandiflorum]
MQSFISSLRPLPLTISMLFWLCSFRNFADIHGLSTFSMFTAKLIVSWTTWPI